MALFSALNIPTTGVSVASLGITAQSLGIQSGLNSVLPEVTDGSRRPYSIPSIYSVNMRGNAMFNNYSWDNSDDWTNFSTYLGRDTPWDMA